MILRSGMFIEKKKEKRTLGRCVFYAFPGRTKRMTKNKDTTWKK